ncbi:MAG: response regulator transcription factor [Chloroflexi bacterium]|nr:response regulator transcription factor [Chloroflexota bacterium]MDA1241056.1 response regulator transcription factor [Chloroflexota bacterium]
MTFNLRWPEADVVSAGAGEEGVLLAEQDAPDIIILDIGLPDIDGFEVLARIRQSSDVPVVMLSARHEEVDKVKGLELGADDYVTKPFSHTELLARVRAVLRRTESQVPASDGPPYEAGPLFIDYASRDVLLSGDPIKLTPIEYGLLYHLTRNENRVLTFRTLLAKVWGREYMDETDYLKVHIQHLRRKIGDDPQNDPMIVNERGVGYKFVRRDRGAARGSRS